MTKLSTVMKSCMLAVLVLNLTGCFELNDFSDFDSCHYSWHNGEQVRVCTDGDFNYGHHHRHHRRGPRAHVDSDNQFHVNVN